MSCICKRDINMKNNAVKYNLLHEGFFSGQNEKLLHLSQNKKAWQYTFFLLYINDLPDDVICDIAIYANDTTLYSKCDQASDLWQQLELASKLESDLRDTMDWVKKRLVNFNPGKTHLVSFDGSNNAGAIDVKMNGSVLEEKSLNCLLEVAVALRQLNPIHKKGP